MARLTDLSTEADFAVEHQRENIRDRRSSRYRRNVEAISGAIARTMGAMVSIAGLAHLLGWL